MHRSIAELQRLREAAVTDQGILFARILEDCAHPEIVSPMLHQLEENALRYQELCSAISKTNDILDRAPAWVKPFLK